VTGPPVTPRSHRPNNLTVPNGFQDQKMPKFPLKFRQRLLKRRDIIAVQASLRLVSDLLKPQYGRRIAQLRQ
jgi:hypothetical protein